MGKNSSGWPEILVRGRAGDRVRMLPGELLNPDGSVTQASAGAGPDNPVLFDYTLAGGEERWHPRFTYYGFRYVQVETIPAKPGGPKPKVLSLQTDFIHDDVAIDGHFTSGVTLLNRIHALIDRAILSNLVSVITDCPTREKLGWLEQTHLAGSSIMNNYGVLKLYEKIADDIAEAQLANGFVPAIAPEYVAFVDANGNSTNFRDSPEWGSASILDPWQAYQFYGDSGILRDHYDSMVQYAGYLRSKLHDGMLNYGLGDWYDIGPRPPGESQLTGKGLTATAIYYQDLTTLAATASLLGNDADAARFGNETAEVRETFNSHLLHADTATYDRGSQTAQAMPLVLGLVPENLRQAVLENLIKDIRAHGNHVTAGDIGFHYVVRALTDNGRSDVLFDMLSRRRLAKLWLPVGARRDDADRGLGHKSQIVAEPLHARTCRGVVLSRPGGHRYRYESPGASPDHDSSRLSRPSSRGPGRSPYRIGRHRELVDPQRVECRLARHDSSRIARDVDSSPGGHRGFHKSEPCAASFARRPICSWIRRL